MRERWMTGKPEDWDKPATSVDTPAKRIEDLKAEVQEFIDRFQALFQTIAGDNTLRYEAGDGFYIDLKGGVIRLDIKDFIALKEGGLNSWQILWSVCHEIAHFRDLRESPEAMLEHFEYLERRAKELVPQTLEIWKRKFGEPLPDYLTKETPRGSSGRTTTFIESFLYKKLHLFYNSLDDMYVNGTISERTPIFRTGGAHADDINHLYQNYLFPAETQRAAINPFKPSAQAESADYRTMPRSHQFAYALLRERMVKHQDVVVTDEVRGALEGYPSALAERLGLNAKILANKVTTPGANGKEFPERDPGWRYEQIRDRLEPFFIDLLMKDMAEFELPKLERNPGNPSPWDELDQKPEPIDFDTIKQYIDGKKSKDADKNKADKAAKKAAEQTPEDRAKAAQAKADQLLCQNNGESPQIANDYRRLEQEIEPYKRELAHVFEEFMKTIQEHITSFILSGFRSGKLDVASFVREHAPDLVVDEGASIDFSRLEVYQQRELISRLKIWPDAFRVRLVVDGSGSMQGDRILMAKKVAVLLLEALATFEETMNLRFRLQKPFVVDTEVRIFGDGDTLAKPFHQDDPSASPIISKFKAVHAMQATGGTTKDAPSFAAIDKSLTPDRAKALQTGRAKELIIYIADGGSVTADESRRSIQTITDKGAVGRGLLIGTPSDKIEDEHQKQQRKEEEKIFSHLWGENGAQVGDLAKLPTIVASLLREEIAKTKIQISQYEDVGDEGDID